MGCCSVAAAWWPAGEGDDMKPEMLSGHHFHSLAICPHWAAAAASSHT